MLYPDLANTAASTIRAHLTTAGLPITPATNSYLEALSARTRCWKGIFVATATWIAQASAQEQAVAWQAIVAVCDADQRPLAAMSRLYIFQANAAALKTLWQALPADSLLELQVALAANPLLLAMFKDPSSGVTGLPSALTDPAKAAALWARVRVKMEKLSRFENAASK
jgi:hypothetical protein